MIAACGAETAAVVTSDDILSRVKDAHRAAEHTVQHLRIAGEAIELAATDSIASFLLPPFAHLTVDRAQEPALRIAVAALDERDPLAAILDTFPDSGVLATEGEQVLHLHPQAAVTLDRSGGMLYALMRNDAGRGIASWHRAKPLQVPLSIFFADRGIDLLHGGLVSLRGQGVLIAGVGGSGKSTLTLASLLAGLDILGDDCVAMRKTGESFTGYSVFASTTLERDHLRNFPSLTRTLERSASTDAKQVLPLAMLEPERTAIATTIRAIMLPRVTRGASVTVTPAAPRDALLALAPSSILRRAVPPAAALARMAALARAVPAYRLEMGPVEEAGSTMRAFLEEICARGEA